MKEIDLCEIEGFRIGNAEDAEKGTGCTVILCGEGAAAGMSVRGGGPASRESELLKATAHAQQIQAVVLGGGSAYGLGAANGVMQYLAERKIGFPVGDAVVPLVVQSDIFDLLVGEVAWPDPEMAYQACVNAEKGRFLEGSHGAGTGASVGKILGSEHAMKSGLGSYALQVGDLKVGALICVNAMGDVFDHRNGAKLAGVHDGKGNFTLPDSEELFFASLEKKDAFAANTTIGVILTNARFRKPELIRIADNAHNGMARAICPVHTLLDGDTLYALSKGEVEADLSVVGALAARVTAEAIKKAVLAAEPAYGLFSAKRPA
ncbi:MAG: P1 family peptidase [Erysipelotrichaceae bacterium]|nr:P1 family peptidase [Erysipelotrichaceae bacterium]